MFIRSLHLTNVRSHQDTQLEFDRINLIRGPNGGGKSTLQLALALLLTSQCGLTDAGGRGAQDLIRSGTTEMVIEAVLSMPDRELVLTLRRSTAGSMLTVGNLAAGKDALRFINQHICNLDVLSAVLNAGRFVAMAPKDQKALLAAALEPDPVPVDAEITQVLGTHFRLFADLASVRSVAEVEAAYQAAYDRRTELGRDIKAIGEPPEPTKPDGMPTLDETRNKIAALRTERDTLVQARGALLSGYRASQDAILVAEAQKRMHEPHVIDKADELEKLRKTAAKKEQAAKLDVEIAGLTDKRNTARTAAAELMGSPEGCPTCQRPWDLTQQAERAGRLAQAQEELEAIQKQLAAAQDKRLKIGDPDEAERRCAAHKNAMMAIARADQVLKGEHAPTPDTAELDAQIQQLDQRLTHGQNVERQVVEYEGAQRAFHQATEKLTEVRRRHLETERLVEYFGPSSKLRTALIAGKLDPFRARINDVLDRFGFQCRFELEPYSLSVQRMGTVTTGPFLWLHQLSESEQYRFGIAFQVALAETTGVNMVMIDRADMLLADGRRRLTAALMDSGLDQVFLLASAEPTADAPQFPGVRFFNLSNDNGSTRVDLPATEDDQERYVATAE
jgi:energy-coupling factor transporter ATP-binding protein EcfA2